MFKLQDHRPWMWLAIATGALSIFRLFVGEVPTLVLTVCLLAAACAVNQTLRDAVTNGLLRLFNGSTMRSLVIIFGAIMLIQLLPLESALLMAGDVLIYLEAVAAVTLIAANMRLRPMVAALRVRFETAIEALRGGANTSARRPRDRRRMRPPSPLDDPERSDWVLA